MTDPNNSPMIVFSTSERFLNKWGVGTDLFLGAIRDGDQCIALIARDGLTDEKATNNAERIVAALSARPLPSDWVAVPRDPVAALPILRALADAAGLERLPDPGNPDDAYPITGAQSTVLQWYRAMLAAAPSAPAEAVQTATEPLAQHSPCKPAAWVQTASLSRLRDGWSATCYGDAWAERNDKTEFTPLYASPQPAAEAETFLPAGWYSFVHDCAQKRGMEVNGNRLSMKAEELLASLSAAPNPPQPSASVGEPWDECYSPDGDVWYDSPDDANFVNGLNVGDTYELTVSHWSVKRTYVVTKVPDETSDDYEVRPVSESTLTTAAGGGGLRDAAEAFLEAADARDNEETSTQYPQHDLRLRQYKAARDDLEAALGRGGPNDNKESA